MRLLISLNSALRALKKNSRRTVLTMLGIIVGTASVIAILLIGKGFEKQTISYLTKNDSREVEIQLDFIPTDTTLYETNTPFFNDVDLTYVNSIVGVKHVEYADIDSERFTENILVKNRYKSKQIGIFEDSSYEVIAGRPLKENDNIHKNRVAIVDASTAKELYNSPDNAINNHILIDNTMFVIVGIYEINENENSIRLQEHDNVQIPKDTYNYFLKKEIRDKTRLTVSLLEDTDTTFVTNKILNILKNKGFMREFGKYQIFDTTALFLNMNSILSSITYFISSIAGISLLIAGVGIMNMMYISVYERTGEIAIKRALGSTKRNIMYQFLIEGTILTTTGGLVGYLVGLLFASIIGKFINISIFIDFTSILLAICISSMIGIIFTIVPAYEASRKSLIEILK